MNLLNLDNKNKVNISNWALRIGLVFVFGYAGISSLQHPLEWVGYLPGFLTSHVAATTLLKPFAVAELALALWLLVGKCLRYAAVVSALMLAGIVVVNPGQLLITFRDVGLFCMAVALVFSA